MAAPEFRRTPIEVREERREEEREAGLTREIFAEVKLKPTGNFELDWIRFLSAQIRQVRDELGAGMFGSDSQAWEQWMQASQALYKGQIANRRDILLERRDARKRRG